MNFLTTKEIPKHILKDVFSDLINGKKHLFQMFITVSKLIMKFQFLLKINQLLHLKDTHVSVRRSIFNLIGANKSNDIFVMRGVVSEDISFMKHHGFDLYCSRKHFLTCQKTNPPPVIITKPYDIAKIISPLNVVTELVPSIASR